MLKYILLILCNIMAILSTIEYVRKFKFEDKNENIISGVVIYFFRIILFELILGYVVKCLNCYSITLCFGLELIILYILSIISQLKYKVKTKIQIIFGNCDNL